MGRGGHVVKYCPRIGCTNYSTLTLTFSQRERENRLDT